jgi:polysaccharide pyruvyl transferase WcaK-like protein
MIGGGGLWGLDVNSNIFVLSSILFFSRWVLRKNVYLLGVGYYSSTNRLGHISAWLAGKAATAIIARDQETLTAFSKLNKRVYIDTDIAWHINALDLQPYQKDIAIIEEHISITQKTLFITLRRFQKQYKNNYTDIVAGALAANQDKPIVVAILEPKEVDPEGYALLTSWKNTYPNIQIIDFSFNPLVLFLFFTKYQKQLVLISPQFHALITAHLNHVAFLPLVYDNKSAELLKQIGYDQHVHIRDITQNDVQTFIAKNFIK